MIWLVTATSHAIIAVSYAWIAVLIARGQWRDKQWFANPLATGTFAIFAVCAVGHGVHMEHAILGNFGIEPEVGEAARLAMSDWALVIWTPITALAAIWYLTMRQRLRYLRAGTPMVEDMVKRQKEAQIIHDNVMNNLSRARQALAAGNRQEALDQLEAAQTGSDEIISSLLGAGAKGGNVRPGDLRRGRASK